MMERMISFRVSEKDYRLIRLYAEKKGKPMSDVAREAVLEKIKEELLSKAKQNASTTQ
ncbi:MAG: DUF6290 family protein [Candidatus Micrarchaeaceae archaeon]